jgi:hypothetical protein
MLFVCAVGGVLCRAATGPVAWWNFDEGTGSIARDASGHGLDGVLGGSATRDRGMVGGALRLDGAGYVEVRPDARLGLGRACTIQAWVQPLDHRPNSYKHIADLWDSYLLRLDSPSEGGKLSWFVFLDGKPEPRLSSRVPELGQWHLICAVWDGTNMDLWLDAARRTQPRAGAPKTRSGPLRLGANFIGLLDEVKVYDRALTEQEILSEAPAKPLATLSVSHPVVEIGRPFAVSCTVSNAGGQALTHGRVVLVLPAGLRCVAGTTNAQIARLTHAEEVRVQWQVHAETALSQPLASIVEFPGHRGLTNVADCVVARSGVSQDAAFTKPALIELGGGDLALGNTRLRLLFPRNRFGYGVWAVEVRQGSLWRRLAMANALSQLVVRGPSGPSRQMIFARRWQTVRNVPEQAGIQFQEHVADGAGNRWDCRFQFLVGRDDRVKLSLEATPQRDAALVRLQGPTLYVGEGSFGRQKEDALFCGLEWLVGEEGSSSDRDMHDPDFYLRCVPHPNKITIPLMGVAQGGAAIALYWDCRQSWDGKNDRPAAVFASPNFLDGQNNHLLGLFLPPVPDWAPPNQREATAAPYPAAGGVPLRLEAWLTAVAPATQTLACVPRWFETFGVPEPAPLPRGSYTREVEFSMRALLESLWDANRQKWWTSKGGGEMLSSLALPPHFAYQLRLGALLTGDPALRDRCNQRAALAEQLGRFRASWDDLGFTWGHAAAGLLRLRDAAAAHLDAMGGDGAWRFRARIETDGVFAGRDYGLLGPDAAAELGTCARRAYEIARYARLAGDGEAFAAVTNSLAFMQRFAVPRAAQVWECPVHTPDILAAADAVEAFLEAYRFSGERRYLDHATYWARTGLPFVYVWNPQDHPVLRYASIAIFGGSWYEGSWIGQPVQWNGLRYAYALLKLADHDSSFPWRKIAEGLTVSALYQMDTAGTNVALWPDNFSALDWSKCPWVFEPSLILKNLCRLLDREIEPDTVSIEPGIRITSRARISATHFQDGVLRCTARFPEGESGQVLLAGLTQPRSVTLGGSPVPQTTGDVWGASGPVWRYDSGAGFVTLKLTQSGPVTIEVADSAYRRVALIPPIPSLAEKVSFEFTDGPDGWAPVSQVPDWHVREGRWQGVATGGDPYLHRMRLRVDGSQCSRVVVRERATAGQGLALYWLTADSRSWGEDKVLRLPFTNRAEFNQYVFEVGRHAQWKGHTIVALRLDPFEGDGGGNFELDYIRGE